MLEIGLSKPKAKEYLDLVLDSHNWENRNGKIKILEKTEAS